jgi:predicted PurR-regulated permease PerM
MEPTNRVDSQFYRRVFALAVAGLLGFALVRILQPFIGPILWGILLAFLLFPVNTRLRRDLGGRQGVAAIVVTIAVILLLVGPAILLVAAFANQAAELVGHVQKAAARYQIAQPSDLYRVPILDRILRWIEELVPVTTAQVEGGLLEGTKALLQVLASFSGSFLVGVLDTVIGLVMTLLLLFFFLRDGEVMVQKFLLLIPMDEERKEELMEHLAAVTRAVALGALMVAIIQGMLVGIAFVLAGLPSPLVFGVLAAITSLVPLVGASLVWAPAAVVIALQGRWAAALFLTVWGLAVVTSADHLIRPRLIAGRAQISTLPVLLGLIGGVGAYGPIGLVLGPVVIALVLALLRFVEESQRKIREPSAGPGPG